MAIIQEVAKKTAQPVQFSYHLDSLSQQRAHVFTPELQRRLPTPLAQIQIDAVNPEDAEKIQTINVMHQGAYALTLMYDQLVQRSLRKVKKGRMALPEESPFTPRKAQEYVERIADYSMAVGDLSYAYTNGEPIEELVANVTQKSQEIFAEILGGLPQVQEKTVDGSLGINAFLRSEADSVGIEVHDIRSPLTAIKGRIQLAEKKGESLDGPFPERVKEVLKEHANRGEVMRRHLAAQVPLEEFNPIKFAYALKEFLHGNPLTSDWNVIVPDPENYKPPVLFNRERFKSLFENALSNADKSRRLLEERFLLTAFSAVADKDVPRVLRFLNKLEGRAGEMHTLEVAFDSANLRRRTYLEVMFRDNGIGNDHINGTRRWRRNFAVGDSRWSTNDSISGTGIAMGTHRAAIKELFKGTHADIFLRNRTDGKHGAELVVRLPETASPLY